MIGDFHFLRPEWLLALPAAAALAWLVSRREDVRKRWRGTIAPHLLDHLVVELTPDQQGRLAYERGDYETAAERFADPMWRGVALYRAGRYEEALDAFARLDTAQSDYNQGNALARLGKLLAAVASYQAALKRRPDWPEAKANLALVQRLIPPEKKDDGQEAAEPSMEPDEIQVAVAPNPGFKPEIAPEAPAPGQASLPSARPWFDWRRRF